MFEKVHKLIISYEKEENWLNQMSSVGMMLRKTGCCTYYFEKGITGEYIYRIELLPKMPSHPRSKAYIDFLEENGVECVSTVLRWAYFRKKASDGPFDIYSDIDSKISHYKRILFIYVVLFLLNLFAVAVNIFTIVYWALRYDVYHYYILHKNFICFAISTSLSVCFGSLCFSYIKKIHKLKKQKQLIE